MGKHQVILLDNPNVGLQVTSVINAASLLPVNAAQSPEHDGLHVIQLVYSSRPHLSDLFTNGSSFMNQGRQCTGYAGVILKKTVGAKALCQGAQLRRQKSFL